MLTYRKTPKWPLVGLDLSGKTHTSHRSQRPTSHIVLHHQESEDLVAIPTCVAYIYTQKKNSQVIHTKPHSKTNNQTHPKHHGSTKNLRFSTRTSAFPTGKMPFSKFSNRIPSSHPPDLRCRSGWSWHPHRPLLSGDRPAISRRVMGLSWVPIREISLLYIYYIIYIYC